VRQDTQTILQLAGDWVARETGLRDPAELQEVVSAASGATRLGFDAHELGRWDSALIAFVQGLQGAMAAGGAARIELDPSGLPAPVRRLLALGNQPDTAVPPGVGPPSVSLAARVGEIGLAAWSEAVAVAALVGETALRAVAAIAGTTQTRGVDVLQLMREAGAGALGIVAIVNLLVGAILAFVGAVQLRRFGAGVFVADLVGISIAREMAAVITAIVMAGRTGGAYAAQLATMQGNEEIDALRVLGIPVTDFLVLPRIAALVAMMPLLYVYGCALGLLGGFLVSVAVLDLTPVAYLEETRAAIAGRHFVLGFAKSLAFGSLVALAGCHIGLRAGRSAAAVGRAATSAVVAGIIGIIVLDAVFAVCANALGV
jgi:phospholipid/cholesterol/gamma-HCH transport system permease protein